MSENQYDGLESQGADLVNGDPAEPMATTRAPRSAARRVAGKIRRTADRIETAIGGAAETATAAVSRLSDRAAVTADALTGRAQAAYGRASERAHDAAERVEPFVHARPYAALGIAASAGLLIGMLLARSGSKVFYVRNPTH